jgi:hypothetical protein
MRAYGEEEENPSSAHARSSIGCSSFLSALGFMEVFPNPIVLDASLRFLSEKVSGVFLRVIPYAFPFWSIASYSVVLMVIVAVMGRSDESRSFIPYCLAFSVATITNTILFFSGIDVELLTHSSSLVGRLPSWPRVLLELRNKAFEVSSFLSADISHENSLKTNLLETLRVVLTLTLILGSSTFGYTPTIGALAAISCSVGTYSLCTALSEM